VQQPEKTGGNARVRAKVDFLRNVPQAPASSSPATRLSRGGVPSQPSPRAPQGLCSLEDVDDYDLADATGEGDYQPLGRNGLPVQAPAQRTAEQRDRIEMNRQLALERAQAALIEEASTTSMSAKSRRKVPSDKDVS